MGTVDKIKERMGKDIKDTMVTHVCPICGAAPTIKSKGFDPWGDMGYDCCTEFWLECSGCGVIKAGAYDNIHDKDTEAKNKAIKDWNEVAEYIEEFIESKRKAEGKK